MHRASLCWLVAAGVLACDGSNGSRPPPADPAGTPDAASPDASPEAAAPAVDAAVTPDQAAAPDAFVHPPDAAAPGDARLEPDLLQPSGLPLPASVPAPRRFLSGNDRLTGGGGLGACSHQDPPSGNGDRWCGFIRGTAGAATAELWVMNITRAAADGVPPCDGSSPACIRLTRTLWTEFPLSGPVHPFSHQFSGDTLLFYADATSGPSQLHRGPVYAWRPGWSQPRQISSGKAVMCWAHDGVAVAHCLDDLIGDPMSPEAIELRAGPLADAADLTLPTFGRIRPSRKGNSLAWQAAFSPKADYFLVSSPDPDPDVEALRIVETAQIGKATPREILRGMEFWEPSPQSRSLFFVRADSAEEKSLHVAEFPTGANPTKLTPALADFIVLGDPAGEQGIAYVTYLGKQTYSYRLLRDLTMPASATTLFTFEDMLEGLNVSRDMRFTAWADTHFDLRVVRHSDLASCYLNTTPKHDAFHAEFLHSAGLVFWKEDADDGADRLDGYLADPDTCMGKQRFAYGLDFSIPIGDRLLVFGDEFDGNSARVTLKYAEIADGKRWPAAGAVRIHANVDDASVFVLGEKPLLMIFQVTAGGSAEEGTYLFGPAPL
jgi:hypothetical protein